MSANLLPNLRASMSPLILVTCALLLLVGACSGGDNTSTPSPTPSEITVTPSQSFDRAILDDADRLQYEGFFEEAEEHYKEAADIPQLRSDALWSLARIQFSRGEAGEAADSLTALLAEQLDSVRERQALLLLGAVQASLGMTDEARDPLQQYVNLDGPAAPYATARLAQIAAKEDDLPRAIELLNGAIAAGLSLRSQTDAQFTLAAYYETDGNIDVAVSTLATLTLSAATEFDRGEALWEHAEITYNNGLGESARQSLATLVLDYPDHNRSLEALSHPALTFGVSTFDRAVVLFRHRLNADATATFEAFLAEQPSARSAADAHHHLGILSERAGAYSAALDHYDTAIALLVATPSDSVAAAARWDRALVLHLLGRLEEAVAAYLDLADTAPAYVRTPDALFRAGLVRFQQGLAGSSLDIWERYMASAPASESQAKAEFWLARAWEALGDQVGAAATHYQRAIDAAPLDYYGLRATAELGGLDQPPSTDSEPTAPSNWDAVESWLLELIGPEDQIARADLFSGAWERALELQSVGLILEADAEFIDIRDRASKSPWLLYRLASAASSEGIIWLRTRAAGLLIDAVPDAPRTVVALEYPLAYIDLARAEAAANGISPYLLLGLVRQESLYDPMALSPANAMGLTQVIPATAASIAADLGATDFSNPDLFRPHISLEFGAYYLASTLETVGGSISAALAGYNGGPFNAVRWQEQAAGDPDVFLEVIEFTETRSYVELVLENYALYLYAYGFTTVPALPF